jgi:hypothetical protein
MVHRRSSTRADEYAELAEVLREAIKSAGLPVLVEQATAGKPGLVA